MADKTVQENIETAIEMTVMTEAETGPEKGHFQKLWHNRTRGTSNSRSCSGFKASTNKDRIHFNKCREYNHFERACPTSKEEKEIEQLQQMLNLVNEQTMTSPMSNTQDKFSRVGSEENLSINSLNL